MTSKLTKGPTACLKVMKDHAIHETLCFPTHEPSCDATAFCITTIMNKNNVTKVSRTILLFNKFCHTWVDFELAEHKTGTTDLNAFNQAFLS